MKIVFSHGKESGPWGTKIRRLADIASSRGLVVESVDYTDTVDPDIRVKRLESLLERETDRFLLAGSSMGGYVSLVASGSRASNGLFLMAPALFMHGYEHQSYPTRSPVVYIVHGWNDDIVPVEGSIRFAGEQGHVLHLVNGNHALSDVLDEVDGLFSLFLDSVL